jgi:hypothetical protein
MKYFTSLEPFRCKEISQDENLAYFFGGEAGIRTLGALSGTTVFKTVTLNHSVTSPCGLKVIVPHLL